MANLRLSAGRGPLARQAEGRIAMDMHGIGLPFDLFWFLCDVRGFVVTASWCGLVLVDCEPYSFASSVSLARSGKK